MKIFAKEEITTKARDIISVQLGVKKDEIKPESSFIDNLGADSLDLVELVMASEEEFGIRISDEEAEKIETVKDLIEYIYYKSNDKEYIIPEKKTNSPKIKINFVNILKTISFNIRWFYDHEFKRIISKILDGIAFLIRAVALTILAGVVIIIIGVVGIIPLVAVFGVAKFLIGVFITTGIIWAFCRLENKEK